MAPIVATTEVALPAERVFPYVIDPRTMSEWQQNCVSGHMDGSPTRIGSRCTTVRRTGGREREIVTEVTEYDPPYRWADRGTTGSVRAVVAVKVESLDSGRSRVTIQLDFEGRGIGRLLVPLIVRPQAAREMPENMERLKLRLEGHR